jgi:hypothetical protein
MKKARGNIVITSVLLNVRTRAGEFPFGISRTFAVQIWSGAQYLAN